MKIEFSSQRTEMLLFLTTNMATVTSRASQQYFRSMAIQAVVRLPIVFVQVTA